MLEGVTENKILSRNYKQLSVRSLGSTWKRCRGEDGEMDVDAVAKSLAFVLKALRAALICFKQMIVISKFMF